MKLFEGQKAEVLNNMKKHPDGPETAWMFDQRVWLNKFTKVGAALHAELVKTVGEDVYQEIIMASPKKEIGIGFDVFDPKISAYLAEKTMKFAVSINRTTDNQLRESLVQGVTAGETMVKLTSRVQTVFHYAETYRNERIARTEVLSSYNYASQAAYVDAGIEKNEWLATKDSRVRDSHAALDGQIRKIGEEFSNGLVAPGDISGPANEVINCRCTLLPVVDDDVEKPEGAWQTTDVTEVLTPEEYTEYRNDMVRRNVNGLGIQRGSIENDDTAVVPNAWSQNKDGVVKAKEEVAANLSKKLGNNPDVQKAVKNYFEQVYGSSNATVQFGTADYNKLTAAQLEQVKRQWIGEKISVWAGTSGDSDPEAVAMQKAVQKEFNLKDVSTKHFTASSDEVKEIMDNEGKALQAISRAQYDLTQEWYAEQNIKHVYAFRGSVWYEKSLEDFGVSDLKEVTCKTILTQTQPMSSFSYDYRTAQRFSAIVTQSSSKFSTISYSKIPVSRILSNPRTGFGCLDEAEMVILGGTDKFITVLSRAPGLSSFYSEFADIAKQTIKTVFLALTKQLENTPNLDGNLGNADWTKISWDLVFVRTLKDMLKKFNYNRKAIRAFIKLPVWIWNRKKFSWAKKLEDFANGED